MSAIREQMQAGLVVALRAADRDVISVLRTALAALSNAEAVDPAAGLVKAGLLGDVAPRSLSATDAYAIVADERDGLHVAAAEYDRLGRPDEAARCRAQAVILDGYLEA